MSTHLTVTRTEMLTPTLRRVWFHSDDLSAFSDSEQTDRYVKLVFPEAVRTYTAMFPDVENGTLAIDFVVHGDEGLAGPWAGAAVAGDTLTVNGPGGGYRPDTSAAWHLLAGDEAAVPAISAALADLPGDAVVRVVVLVDSPAHEPALSVSAAGTLRFVHRSTPGDTLADAVRELDWLPGRVHAFVHGEAEEVMHGVRPYLLKEKGLSRDQVSISGYWRRGRSEEGFRVWKSDLARTET